MAVDDLSFEINLLASLGYNRTTTTATAEIDSGEYLGAPDGAERAYLPLELCTQ